MKIKPIATVMPVMFALLTGCNTLDSTSDSLNSMWPFNHHHHHHHGMYTVNSNGDIIQNSIEANKAEIEAAKLAKMRSHCHKVRHFAEKLLREHRHNLREVRRISHQTGIAPVMNSAATRIEENSRHQLADLRALHGEAFDRAFINDMVADHEDALHMLDMEIMQSTDAKLTAYLKSTREAVKMHLHQAKELQRQHNA